jgi:hypothetical protein
MKIAECTQPDSHRIYLDGFTLYRTPQGWRCADPAGSLRRPLSELEAGADTALRVHERLTEADE